MLQEPRRDDGHKEGMQTWKIFLCINVSLNEVAMRGCPVREMPRFLVWDCNSTVTLQMPVLQWLNADR